MSGDAIIALLQQHGLWLLAPLSIIEGPIVSILAGWLVGLGIMALVPSFVILVLGDVIGDALLYAAGRGVRLDRLPVVGRFFRIPRAKLVPVVKAFRDQGIKLLVIGKATQAAGFVVLIGAGAARMNFALFLLVNTLAAIPKAALLLAVGYAIGEAHERIAAWLSWGTFAIGGVAVAGAALWFFWRRRKARAEVEASADNGFEANGFEAGAPEAGFAESAAPEAGVRESGAPEAGAIEASGRKNDAAAPDAPEHGMPESDITASDMPPSGVPKSDTPEAITRETTAGETGAPQSKKDI